MLQLDHILYAVPDLQQGIDAFEQLTGVRPAYGGQHPHLGTHNALVSLGDDVYCELIAPDPAQNTPRDHMIFDIGTVTVPKIITWAVRTTDLDALSAQMPITNIQEGGRITDQGAKLKWKTADIAGYDDRTGVVPFVISWGNMPHPARTSPSGCALQTFSAEHPAPQTFTPLAAQLSFTFVIVESLSARLTCTMHTPHGVIAI